VNGQIAYPASKFDRLRSGIGTRHLNLAGIGWQ
jgi:hypothetical protein